MPHLQYHTQFARPCFLQKHLLILNYHAALFLGSRIISNQSEKKLAFSLAFKNQNMQKSKLKYTTVK